MKKPILILLLLISGLTFGQDVAAPYQMSKNELLSNDAYQIFKTNKFLDYKEKDSLIESINNVTFKKIELYNYFGYKKNWAEIENETFETYKENKEGHKYIFQDSTMIETYNKFGSYNVNREIKIIYNSKGFITYQEEKVFVGDNFNENRIIINQFDEKNRVVKIISKTERENNEKNQETIIEAIYDTNTVTVKSENGTMVCKFIKDKNSVGYISQLSPRETASNFMYALGQRRFDYAKEYSTDKMIDKLKVMETLNNQIVEVSLVSGSGTFSDTVTIKDIWNIKFSTSNKEKYNVIFIILKQKNGWKIDEFKIEK